MCGRFTLTVHHLEQVADSVDAVVHPAQAEPYRPRYNIAPGNRHWVVRSGLARRELVPATWGLINTWAQDPAVGFRQINARVETLATKPAWRVAYRQRRCVVPADGFFEWWGPPKDRRPIWFHAPSRALLWFAGLWEDWTLPATGEVRTTFTIVTTPSAPPVDTIHQRMPAVVPAHAIDGWLHGPEPAAVLAAGGAAALVARPVSRRVNSATHDDPQCLDAEPASTPPPTRAAEPKQGRLF